MPARLITVPALTASMLLALLPAASAAKPKLRTIGTVTISLTPPPGFCELEESKATDARMLTALQGVVGGLGNRLLGMFADCRQLKDWRTGKRQLLDDYVSYQTRVSLMDAALPLPAEQFVRELCVQMRAEGEKTLTELMPDVKSRIEQALTQVKVNEMRFLGVIAEDPAACYSAMLQKFRTEAGTDKTGVAVLAAMVVKGKMVYFFLISPFVGDGTATTMLTKHKANVAAFLAANKN